MNLSVGIIGLPNAGKSTLFNALTNNSVPAENYPFTTIEPNVGIVPINDMRVEKVAEAENSNKIIRPTIKFVDIAGLVKNASQGEGLGNKFLSHIREVNAVIHIIRNFKNNDVSHPYNNINIRKDKEIVETELKLKDIEILEKKIGQMKSKARSDEETNDILNYLKKLLEHLNNDKLAIEFPLPKDTEIQKERDELNLLTDKPIIYLLNDSQELIDLNRKESFSNETGIKNEKIILMDVKLEEEISKLDPLEQEDFLKDLGEKSNSLDRLVKASFNLLNLITFFTANKNEARANNLKKGNNVIEAAGEIHSDFADNFIAADVINWKNFCENGGWLKSRESGKVKLEGRDYIVSDGDVIFIKHNK